jgi:SAM-dependent methyltransferase
MSAKRPRLLNLGCGARFHADWVNADIAPAAPGVLALDLRKGLPFAAASFDAVYCSHVLEHLPRGEAQGLLRAIHAVLRPGGVVRIVVPDLEAIVRAYLALLDRLRAGEAAREADYDWMLLELYDQAVRDAPGGDMARWLASLRPENAAFVRARIGAAEVDGAQAAPRDAPSSMPRLLQALRGRLARAAARLVGGRDAAEAYAEGAFRRSGEVHRWMYDDYSLARALAQAGFAQPRRRTAFESAIAGFAAYRLDVDEAGGVRKPDSMYMEAVA